MLKGPVQRFIRGMLGRLSGQRGKTGLGTTQALQRIASFSPRLHIIEHLCPNVGNTTIEKNRVRGRQRMPYSGQRKRHINGYAVAVRVGKQESVCLSSTLRKGSPF